MLDQPIDYIIAGDDYELPRVFRARQLFRRDKIDDIGGEVARRMNRLPLPDLNGKRVALTAGSRGIANQDRILRAIADFLKTKGAKPFVVPAMGSHGGATGPGQKEFIAGYGIDEETMGVPIVSDMDVVRLGTTASGFPVYCDRNAAEADYMLPVNRVKPHTSFKGDIESGVCKMLVIGLGKHVGATRIHQLGFSIFPTLIQEAARVVLATGKVLAGFGIVENGYDETMMLEAMAPEEIIPKERELLKVSKEVMARLQVQSIDVLVVEELGKDISGAGIDPNVTGRTGSGLNHWFADLAPPIACMALLGLSEKTHGNACGMGLGDVVTRDFVKQVDFGSTYTNCLAARLKISARMPMIANDERDALRIATTMALLEDPSRVRLIQIVNSLLLSELIMSEPYLDEIRNDSRFEILSEPRPLEFDANNRLARLPRPGH